MRPRHKPLAIALLVLLCLSIFVFKEALLKSYLEHYVRSHLGGQCSIKQLSISHNSLSIGGLRLQHKYFRLDIASLKIDFSFPEFIKPNLKRIAISKADINIEDFTEAKAALQKSLGLGKPVSIASPAAAKGLLKYALALDDISLSLKEKDLYLNTHFSFSAEIGSQTAPFEVTQAAVDSFKLNAGAFSCALRVEPAGDKRYTLYVDSVKRQDQEIKDISLPLEVADDNIVIKQSPFVFLGPATSIQGRFELFSFDHFCFKAFLNTAVFTNVVQFFGQEKNVTFDGPFNGEFGLCWEKGDFSDISAKFQAAQEGTINIRKEVSFDFLKKYLDEASRKALVDSFNNYSYNNGTLTVAKQADTISFHFDFNSQERGRRDVLINFHMGQ